MNQLCSTLQWPATRREILQRTSTGFGWLALAALAAEDKNITQFVNPLAPKAPHFPARAKRVIFMFMNGGPSHLESFDYKPKLAKAGGRYLAPQFGFKPSGKSGLMISEIFPHLSKQADELCLLNSVTTKNPGHQQAVVALHTGNENFVRPSLGAWVSYGLGTEAADLPAFVTIDPIGDQGGAMNYGSAFLPATFQGTRLSGGGGGLPNLSNQHLTPGDQRAQIDFMQKLNHRLIDRHDPGNPEMEGLIQSYELAFQMQGSVPKVFDTEGESPQTLEMYGINDSATARFGQQCLMARRLAEKGVRFIQLTSNGWDHHNKIREAFAGRAESIDKPMAGLIADLKQRDMLKDTLIVWGGEFGRGPHEDRGGGRGHHARGYSMWMAGGGVKGGMRYGATDELGEVAVEKEMPTHDLHATILHLLGLDHTRLTYRYAGRNFRLTDVEGEVHKGILA
ncbi:MAG: Sulfatase [Verrucomicrobiaceae bacterium]|nr:Sulfatase [Verrucomicrobiaceae bacterium]